MSKTYIRRLSLYVGITCLTWLLCLLTRGFTMLFYEAKIKYSPLRLSDFNLTLNMGRQ